jgi:uncharacterized RDD family membrane protein YckC
MRYCSNCGTELAEDARFCGNCGATVAAPTAPPVTGLEPEQPSWQQAPAAASPPPPPPPPMPPNAAGTLGLPASVKLSSPLRRLGAYLLDILLAIVTLLIGWLIWSLIVWGRGQTPGKQLLNMRVIREDTHSVVSWGRMALRELVCKGIIGFVAGATLIGFVLYLWLLWDDENQELWDKMATTLVVDDPQRVLAGS